MRTFAVLSISFFMSLSVFASNYPADYTYQNVRLLPLGSNAYVANVSSGIMSKYVLAYKKSGPLAASNPDFIDAVVEVKCQDEGSGVYTYRNVVRIGKEWGGRGYLSGPTQLLSGNVPDSCRYSPYISVAFSDGRNNWDSQFGRNYEFNPMDFYNSNSVLYRTNESGRYNTDEINDKAWQFLIQNL